VVFIKRKLHCKSCKHVAHWDIAAAEVNRQDGEAELRGEKTVEPKKGKNPPKIKK
jgi:hypothetical protein